MQNIFQDLTHTNWTIDDIADKHGFSDGGRLSTAFKKFHGNPPSHFRK